MELILDFIKIKISTSWIIDFWSKLPDMSKAPKKGGLLNFGSILRKAIATAFVFSSDVKHSHILLGSSHVCCYLFLGGCGQKMGVAF